MKRWLESGLNTAGFRMGLLIVLPARLAGIVLVAAACSTMGCDANSFVPPRPPELATGAVGSSPRGPSAGASVATIPQGGKAIELVLGRHEGLDVDLVKASALKQAGIDKVRVKFAWLSDQEPPARQVELVREAAARHPLALILEPADPSDPTLAVTVHEVQNAGVPVLLIGQSLTGGKPATDVNATVTKSETDAPKLSASSSSRSPILVTSAPFGTVAEQMVATAIRNAKNAKLSPQTGAVILFDSRSDAFVDQRVTAVRSALEAAGIARIDLLPFESKGKRAVQMLTDYLGANPTTVLVFSLDYQSFNANKEVCDSIAEKRPFISASYTSDDNFTGIAFFGEFAGISQLGSTRLLRRAITTASMIAQGREVPNRIEVPVSYFDSSPNSGLPRVQNSGGPKPKGVE